ncbi:hypothetical protein EDD22DRAFT_846977 [Suillus occidentalis]|nr:hypothetical protein EDD22DRAFT_846977 [Suillus occidentalis]
MQSSHIVSLSLSPTPACDSIVTAPNNGSAVESYDHKAGSSAFATSTSPSPLAPPLFEYPCSCARSASLSQRIISTNTTTGVYILSQSLKTLFPESQETIQSEGHSRYSGHGIEKADGVGVMRYRVGAHRDSRMQQERGRMQRRTKYGRRASPQNQLHPVDRRTDLGMGEVRAGWQAEMDKMRAQLERQAV